MFFPLLPRPDVDMCVVVGLPVRLPHIPSPTAEEVHLYHGEYVKQLTALHEKYRAQAGGVGNLEVW
jgi:hypothetical protein